ncbi:carboxy-S-adenosyl-L-methionine synthase CmoA [Desulfosarcina sp. OttesenSCG-928-A07]|nr:carboxy-S-adenosyl-L-methionine synthase CmoA [Desulfosarcina sp. OttesenSCG-928-G17]MDL2328846.1 carboxy-S-adenosyl-L-methionine synthase CmoA [Desulfosarcina sp. OttesenSCG-928-A07]
MPEDHIYRTPQHPVSPFVFDAAVARVFDNMIRRSIPFYEALIHHQARLIQRFYRPGMRLYDLGCSTGTLVLTLLSRMPDSDIQVVAVDTSRPMLDVFETRLGASPDPDRVTLQEADIRGIKMDRAFAVVVNFTLQFIPPEDRDALLRRIYKALLPGGILLLSEKTVHADAGFSDLQTEFYYRFKRENGYSELEISQKREALEKILIPETVSRHEDRMQQCGFSAVDAFLKWFNFCAWICRK